MNFIVRVQFDASFVKFGSSCTNSSKMMILFVLTTVVTAYCVRAAPMDAPMAAAPAAAAEVPMDAPVAMPTTCVGGVKEGDTVERGRYWYVCQKGDLIMKGCMSTDKKRLNGGETFPIGAYIMECASDGKDGFTFKYKGCLSESKEQHMIDTNWQDDNYWYQCMADNNVPKIVVQGCIGNGKKMNIGESLKAGDLIYICQRKSEGTVGFDIFPNHQDKDVTFNPMNPGDDLIYKKQNVPVFINTR